MQRLIILCILLFQVSFVSAQWQPVPPPATGQFVMQLAYNGNTLFAGSTSTCSQVDGKLFYTTNGGNSWSQASNGFPSPVTFNRMLSLGVFGSKVFVSAHDACNVGNNHALFRSDDNGISWVRSDSGIFANAIIQCMAVVGNKLLAGSGSGCLFISSDSGKTWNITNYSTTSYQFYSLWKQGSELYAGTDHGVIVSVDTGKVWTNISSGIGNNHVSSIIYSGSNMLAAVYYTGGLYISTNNGSSWAPVSGGYSGYRPEALVNDGNLTYACSDTTVWMTSDHGITWVNVGQGLTNSTSGSTYSLLIQGSELFLGTNGVTSDIWKRQLSEINTVKKFSNESWVSIFPNPSQSTLNIVTNEANKVHVELAGIDGALILNGQVYGAEKLDISLLKPGVYLIKITGAEKTEIFRIIKN